jgi:uridine kinase
VLARVVVLAGPSGSGKSRLGERARLPVVRLDDFYKDGDDPTLPRIASGANAGHVDWDHPDSWRPEDALTTLARLCRTGRAHAPVYDIARNGRCGTHPIALDGHRFVVAEGVFAQDLVPALRECGLLAAAYCVHQHPLRTFWRRLRRDLRERRKPPRVLLLRGLALMREQREFVRRAVALGCTPLPNHEVLAELAELRDAEPRGAR